MDEFWRDIPGYGGHYMASSFGRIMAKERKVTRMHPSLPGPYTFTYAQRVLRPHKVDKYGHLNVHIGIDGVKHGIGVHRLVLFAFVGLPMPGQEACHNDGDASNNRPENLRWDTHKNNNGDRHKHGRYVTGERHPMAKFPDDLIAKLRAENVDYKDAVRIYGLSRTHAHRLLSKGKGRPA